MSNRPKHKSGTRINGSLKRILKSLDVFDKSNHEIAGREKVSAATSSKGSLPL